MDSAWSTKPQASWRLDPCEATQCELQGELHCRPQKRLFITTVMSWLSCKMGMGTGGNWELIDGKMGMGFKFQMGMGVGWEWEWSHWNGRELGQKTCSRTSLVIRHRKQLERRTLMLGQYTLQQPLRQPAKTPTSVDTETSKRLTSDFVPMLPLVKHFEHTSYSRRPCLAIMQKHDNIQKTEVHDVLHCCQRRTDPRPRV